MFQYAELFQYADWFDLGVWKFYIFVFIINYSKSFTVVNYKVAYQRYIHRIGA